VLGCRETTTIGNEEETVVGVLLKAVAFTRRASVTAVSECLTDLLFPLAHIGASTTEKLEGTLRGADADSIFFPPSLGSLPLLLHPRFTHSLYPAPIFLSPLIQLKGLEKRYKLPMLPIEELTATYNKKLSYRRGTARCVVSVEILPIAMQQCRNYLYDKSRTNRSYEHVYSPER